MDQAQLVVAILVSVFATLFGREFLGQYLQRRQTHALAREQAEVTRETELVQAVINMVTTQSSALIELLKDSLHTNQTMAQNIGQMAQALEGQGSDAQNRYLALREKLSALTQTLDRMDGRLSDQNDYVVALVRTLGGRVTSPDLDEEPEE